MRENTILLLSLPGCLINNKGTHRASWYILWRLHPWKGFMIHLLSELYQLGDLRETRLIFSLWTIKAFWWVACYNCTLTWRTIWFASSPSILTGHISMTHTVVKCSDQIEIYGDDFPYLNHGCWLQAKRKI